jgi:hypothetical protein
MCAGTRKRAHRALAVLAGAILILASCSKPPENKDAQGATDGGIESSWTGYVSKVYPSNLDLSVSAAKTAAQNLNLRVQDENAGFMKRTLGVASDEMSAVIQVQEVTKDSSRVSIKVGWIGDADASRRIHSEIAAQLANLQRQHQFSHGFGGVPPQPPSQ